MFEFRVALKYLVPKRKSLSTALISLLSLFVISLIVWLILVFLSVTKGIEQNWITKLTSLYAPVRIEPKDAYYNSYYYLIDRASSSSNFSSKTLGQKKEAPLSNPYNPEVDPELPSYWPEPDFRGKNFLDPVKELFSLLNSLNIPFQDYEIAGALLRLNLGASEKNLHGEISYLSQMTYLLSFPEENPRLKELLLPGTSIVDKTLPDLGEKTPVLLPKSYLEGGAQIGDRGTLSYLTYGAGSSQEHLIPIEVVGFYDPGILPVGSKCLLAPKNITSTLLASSQTFSPDGSPTNGIFLWTEIQEAKKVQERIEQALEREGLSSFWKVTTFEEFAFAKDLFRQFQSDKTLFLLIAAIILVVACSNIISLLILLVNDKKQEIAILLSMGASKKSILSIFALSGVVLGSIGSLLGFVAAHFTLKHLDRALALLSTLQGKVAFNPLFFGDALPNAFSRDALLFIFIATPLLSLLAGIIPALKASKIHPATTLRP